MTTIEMTINEEQLMQARYAWSDGMLKISRAYNESGITRAKKIAGGFLDDLYGQDQMNLLEYQFFLYNFFSI